MIADIDLVAVETRNLVLRAPPDRRRGRPSFRLGGDPHPSDDRRAERQPDRNERHLGDLRRARRDPRAVSSNWRWDLGQRPGVPLRAARARQPPPRAVPNSDLDSALGLVRPRRRRDPPPHARDRHAESSPGLPHAGCTPTSTASTPRTCGSCAPPTRWQRTSPHRGPNDPDAGAGADPRLGARRQPAGVGDPRRPASSPRRSRSRPSIPCCCGCSPASRSPTARRPGFLPGSPSNTEESAAGAWTSSTAGSSRSSTYNALGRDVRRGHQHLDRRAPAGGP